MKAISKLIAGVGTAALLATVAATPAEAQYRRHDRGVDAGDIITGVAILGGIAAVASAVDRDGGRYGYGYRDRYRGGYNLAVEVCAREASRLGRGQVRITDVDRTGGDRYRVRGIVEAGYGYGGYDRGYEGRYDRDYGRYDRDYGRYDRDYGRYDRDYGRFGRDGREDFTCYARGNGRITDFRL